MVYTSLYELIETYVFGNAAAVGSNAELVCMLVATIGSLFVIAVPFMVVWKVIKMIMG